MKDEAASLLVVDDDEMNRDMLSRRLARRGFAVSVAKDGGEALELAARQPFDLVLLDIMMPGIDGIEVLKRLRKNHTVADLPVIMATAKNTSDDLVRALELGANDYVTKPLDFPVVLARVQTQLSLKRAKAELEAAHARMKKDLEAAARVQQALMPQSLPDVEGAEFAWSFVPCDELAGDILDIFRLDETKIGLYLLDVSGHGVPSALLSVTLSRLLSHLEDKPFLFEGAGDGASGRRLLPPSDVASRLNLRFPMDPETRQYFTFAYGILDMDRLELRYVSAAHPGPIHLTSAAPTMVHPPTGLAIGWFPDATYRESVITLKPGDRLYLCSDGILEAMSPEEEMFGPDRLVDSIEGARDDALTDSIDKLLEAVREWCDVGGPGDDVSVLAVEIHNS
ncbi:MAG: PP2C family protein-serine/threonine phosphatase [Acidobacteriota bacterium]